MLPEDDFLRRLPQILPLVDRLRLETLIFAHDLMEIALRRLHSAGITYGGGTQNATDRIAMFCDAWTIVDQIHVVRQVLLSLTTLSRKSDTQEYLDHFSIASVLRNKMDHLNENLPNRAKANGSTNALFGSLTFFKPHPDLWEQGLQSGEFAGEFFMVSAGLMPDQMASTASFDDLNIQLPICSFRLEAFDQRLLIERAVLQLRALLRRMSDDCPSSEHLAQFAA